MTLSAETLRAALHYDPVGGVFTWRQSRGRQRAGSTAGCVAGNGYHVIGLGGKLHWAHRLAWLYAHGVLPTGTIDHIDGNPLNNALANLRDVPQCANNQNIKRTSRQRQQGMPRGVWKVGPNSFRAQISVEDRTKYLGTFTTPDQASAAYEAARAQFHDGYVGEAA